jgi:hypothetical protein
MVPGSYGNGYSNIDDSPSEHDSYTRSATNTTSSHGINEVDIGTEENMSAASGSTSGSNARRSTSNRNDVMFSPPRVRQPTANGNESYGDQLQDDQFEIGDDDEEDL